MSKSFNRANREQDDRFFSSDRRNPRQNKRADVKRRGNNGDDMSFYNAMPVADRCEDDGNEHDTSCCCDD